MAFLELILSIQLWIERERKMENHFFGKSLSFFYLRYTIQATLLTVIWCALLSAILTANPKKGHHHFFVRKLIIYAKIFDPCDQLPLPSSPTHWTYYIALWYLVVQYSLSVDKIRTHDDNNFWPIEFVVYQ